MSFFEWRDRYLTGIPEFDEDHLKLVGLINKLHDDIANTKDAKEKKIMILKALNEIVKYTVDHFAEEERLMLKHCFPGYEEHKKEHDQFKEDVAKMLAKSQKKDVVMALPILISLRDWLIFHVSNTDQKYAPYLKEKK